MNGEEPPAGRFAVIIASKGRPRVLEETLVSVLDLRGEPRIIVVVTEASDFPGSFASHPRIHRIAGTAGAAIQRNAGIRALNLDELDVVAFLDDDIEVHPEYLVRVGTLLAAHPDIVAGSGHTLRDGDISRDEARSEVLRWSAVSGDEFRTDGRYWTLYGCNMFMRASALKEVQFDENLPSFAFAEDYEISIRLRRLGRVGRFNNAVCVHLRTPGGRVNHRRIAYAMIANNLYFLRKGSVHLPRMKAALRFVYLAMFHVPFVEFLRRCRSMSVSEMLLWWQGCGMAWMDMVLGRCQPARILEL